ncbi:hypothetical protein [Methylorubrum thiocyanatum]|uniref:hypothetical protein n=1 Tax=Methylorubrum thiocyanatum TaxID=47958 RepID=UPI0035C87429
MDGDKQKRRFEKYQNYIDYLESVGVKQTCIACGEGDLVPFDEAEDSATEIEYTFNDGDHRSRLPAFVLLCFRCGYIHRYARLVLDVRLGKIKSGQEDAEVTDRSPVASDE